MYLPPTDISKMNTLQKSGFYFGEVVGAIGGLMTGEAASIGLAKATIAGSELLAASKAMGGDAFSKLVAGVGLSTKVKIRTSKYATQEGQIVFHTVTSPGAGQGILDGIDPEFLNPRSRFGKALYLSEIPETTLAELAHHNAVGTQTIKYLFDAQSAKILDLTNPRIAQIWGYDRGLITAFSKSVGFRAQRAGFDVIRYPSERGLGANLAVLNNFETLLKPQIIVPSLEFEANYVSEEFWTSPQF